MFGAIKALRSSLKPQLGKINRSFRKQGDKVKEFPGNNFYIRLFIKRNNIFLNLFIAYISSPAALEKKKYYHFYLGFYF